MPAGLGITQLRRVLTRIGRIALGRNPRCCGGAHNAAWQCACQAHTQIEERDRTAQHSPEHHGHGDDQGNGEGDHRQRIHDDVEQPQVLGGLGVAVQLREKDDGLCGGHR